MGKWIDEATGARVSVADEKDHRFVSGWRSANAQEFVQAPVEPEPKRSPGRPKKTDK